MVEFGKRKDGQAYPKNKTKGTKRKGSVFSTGKKYGIQTKSFKTQNGWKYAKNPDGENKNPYNYTKWVKNKKLFIIMHRNFPSNTWRVEFIKLTGKTTVNLSPIYDYKTREEALMQVTKIQKTPEEKLELL